MVTRLTNKTVAPLKGEGSERLVRFAPEFPSSRE
jgi:hypothetical protein